ncbi:MAG TPA: phosphoribosyltransferase family protein [Solirubrobacteraceae bacterium]|nr:phosphoribosyltransferase family protein [Solirubrobacteraceae bacterium]
MKVRTGAVTTPDDPPFLAAPVELVFRDRHDAGRRLAALLERFRDELPVVVGMPRGGVPVAAEVARELNAPLDVVVVRKVGAPQNPEYALGAVAEGGVQVLSYETAAALGLSDRDLKTLVARVEDELSERTRLYRGTSPPLSVAGRTAILVDDGLATGRSAHAAIASLRGRGAARVILAVPVAAPSSVDALRELADEIVCVEMPEDMWAVGAWYEDFHPTSDEEVVALLAELGDASTEGAAEDGSRARPRDVQSGGAAIRKELGMALGPDLVLGADVTVPPNAAGLVIFAHGSGSSRLSPRNRAVAETIVAAGYATLLFDLLTSVEELDRANVFDIPLLAHRLLSASAWAGGQDELAGLPLAYFGASTGAAAALTAAAQLGERVHAVISRGGRPDLAADLPAVQAPTLLIVGGADRQVLELNRIAQRQLRCPNELAIVEGATHLFEEPGALEQVAGLAIRWLEEHLAGATGAT